MNEIMLLRINIIPPYCYDGDEGEKTIEEYNSYYEENYELSYSSLVEYLSALHEYSKDIKSTRLYLKLISRRLQFVNNFPFVVDEFDNNSKEFVNSMRDIYDRELKKCNLMLNLESYKTELEKLYVYKYK